MRPPEDPRIPVLQNGEYVKGHNRRSHGAEGFGNGVAAVPFSGRQRFQREDERSFRAHVAVGGSSEGMAFAVCADHAQCIKAAAQAVGSQVGGGSNQGKVESHSMPGSAMKN